MARRQRGGPGPSSRNAHDAGVRYGDNPPISVDSLVADDQDLPLNLNRLIDALSRAAYRYWRTHDAPSGD